MQNVLARNGPHILKTKRNVASGPGLHTVTVGKRITMEDNTEWPTDFSTVVI